ncbi:MAG: mechanosensitive channel MscK, partial [Aeromonas sp.]
MPILTMLFSLITRRVSLCALLVCSALLSTQAHAIPERRTIDSQLAQLDQSSALTLAQQADKTFYSETLSLLDDIDAERAKAKAQAKKLRGVPKALDEITQRQRVLSKAPSFTELKKTLSALSLAELDVRQQQTLAAIGQAQSGLSTSSMALTNLQTLPERAQAAMSRSYQRHQAIRARLNEGDEVSTAEKMKLETESALLELQLTAVQTQLANRTALQDLVIKQRDYYSAHLSREEQTLPLLQEAINAKQIDSAPHGEDGVTAAKLTSPLLLQEQAVNRRLSDQLTLTMTRLNALVQKNLQAKSWLERGMQTERNLNEQVQMLKGKLLLSRILYQLYQELETAPNFASDNLDEQIADLHLGQFELRQQRDQLFNKAQFQAKLIAASGETLTEAQQKNLNLLLENRIRLLDELNRQLDTGLANAISLQLTQQQLSRVYAAIEFTLQQNIFWVSSNKPLDSKWLLSWPQLAQKQLESWSVTPDWQRLRANIIGICLLATLLIICGVLLRVKRPAIIEQRKHLRKDLSRLRKDTQWHTPRALLLCVIQQLPTSLFILAGGLLFTYSGLLEPKLIFQISLNMSLGYLVFSVYLTVIRPGGVAEYHFRMEPTELAAMHQGLSHLWVALLPLIALSTKAVVEPSTLGNDVVGQALTIGLLALLTYLMFPISRGLMNRKGGVQQSLIAITLAFAPAALLILVALGYYYTALKLTGRLLESFYLIIIWNLVYRASLRGLALAARRLAYRRAQAAAKRSNKPLEDAEGNEKVEEKVMDLADVNQQSLRLTVTIQLILFGSAFYWLWSDLVAIFSYLDSMVLWHKTVTGATGNVLAPVSVRDVFTALFMFGAIWSLARNLPGLLEVLVLSRLPLARGAGYTITTMLNYVLIGVGSLSALGLLGMPWEKLQWLAAGLTVGIGFGMQEIVGNFVSGIIILFERPVRIGDTVTIGTFSGTVSKIRIRATTLTDFDRKEVIIPNKALMIERLINWSLSDTVTRVIIRIGVAYGSDLDLTRELLKQAVQENSRVLKEPAPLIYFLTFGPSTLDHELRFFVSELGDRNP